MGNISYNIEMKRTLLLLFFLIILASAGAQNSYIGINLGISVPGTELAGTDDLFNNGYAVSGFSIEFDGIYFPGSIFGIGGMLGFGSYYTQQDPFFDNAKEYLDSHPDNPGFILPDRNEVVFESGFWNIINFMAGPELAVPFWNFQFGVRAMGGPSIIISPKRSLSYKDAVQNVLLETGGTDLSLSYMYGASLMYFLSPGTSIRIAADYYTGKSDYNFRNSIETPLGEMNEEIKKSVAINTLQLSLGLSYAF